MRNSIGKQVRIRVKRMDKVAERLRQDASAIDVSVSPELDERIRASLEAATPEPASRPLPPPRPRWFWWASSLTGAAAALVVIVIVNLNTPQPRPSATPVGNPTALLPPVTWQVETAVLTSPLEQEMADLQSDLKKAEEVLKRDIEAVFQARPGAL